MTLSAERNRALPKYVERFPELVDFYNTYDALDVTQEDVDKSILRRSARGTSSNPRHGDPLLRGRHREPGHPDARHPRRPLRGRRGADPRPAEIWRSNATSIQKLVMTDRDVARFVLDPRRETADGDLSNNVWPPEMDDRRSV